MEKITENVYAEIGAPGCNFSFVVTKEGVVMIDSPMIPSAAVKWREEIAKHGDLKFLINTDPHIDHFAGNYFFDCIGIAHEGVTGEILKTPMEKLEAMIGDSESLDAGYYFRPPDITFSQKLTIHLGDHTFKLINMPGHTPYQAPVYVPEERILFTSDNVVNRVMPYMHHAIPDAWLESLKQLEELDYDVIVPGHGKVCDKSYLKRMQEVVQGWRDAVKEAIDKGMTLEETLEKVSLLERFPTDDDIEHQVAIQQMNISHLYEILKG